MALLVKTADGNWKVIDDESRAVELLDNGVEVYVIDETQSGRPQPRKVRVNEASRVTEVRTVSANLEDDT